MVVTNLVAVSLCFIMLLLCVCVLLAVFFLFRVTQGSVDQVIKLRNDVASMINKYLSTQNERKG